MLRFLLENINEIASAVSILVVLVSTLNFIKDKFGVYTKNKNTGRYYFTHTRILGHKERWLDAMYVESYLFLMFKLFLFWVDVLCFVYVHPTISETVWSWLSDLSILIIHIVLSTPLLIIARRIRCKYYLIYFDKSLGNKDIRLLNMICIISVISFITLLSCVFIRVYIEVCFAFYLFLEVLLILTALVIYIKYTLCTNQNSTSAVNYFPGMNITIIFGFDDYLRYKLDESEITLHDNAEIHIFHSKEGPLVFKDVREVYIAKQKFVFKDNEWVKEGKPY